MFLSEKLQIYIQDISEVLCNSSITKNKVEDYCLKNYMNLYSLNKLTIKDLTNFNNTHDFDIFYNFNEKLGLV